MTAFKHTPEEARRLWVEALRSGEYQQGRGYLKHVDDDGARHCCLGVACEVFSAHERPLEQSTSCCDVIEFASEDRYLPLDVLQWLGLRESSGRYSDSKNGTTHFLANDNDNGETFAEIADIIESAPPGLFVESEVVA